MAVCDPDSFAAFLCTFGSHLLLPATLLKCQFYQDISERPLGI